MNRAHLRPRPRAAVTAALVVAGWTLIGVLLTASVYSGSGEDGGRDAARIAARLGAVCAYSWVPVTLAVLYLARRFPLAGPRLAANAAVLLAAAGPLVVLRMAVLHLSGNALGVLTPGVPFSAALGAYAGETAMVVALLIGAAHAVEYARTARERELAAAHLSTQLAQAQLHALKAQLQPHFLFNALHGVSAMMYHDVRTADVMLARLAELLRHSLQAVGAQEVALDEELAFVSLYLEVERTRLGERLRVEMEVDSSLRSARVPHAVLLPLVENAVRHALAANPAGGTLRIRAARRHGTLALAVCDTGAGGAPRRGGTGVGLANLRGRLERLYPDEARLALHAQPGGGTCASIEIPLRLPSGRPAPVPAEAAV